MSDTNDAKPVEITKEWVNEQCAGWCDDMLGKTKTNGVLNIDVAEATVPRSDEEAAAQIHEWFRHRVTWTHGQDQWRFWNGVYHQTIRSGVIADWIIKGFKTQLNLAMNEISEDYETRALAEEAQGNQPGADALRKEYREWKFGEHRTYRDRLFFNYGHRALRAQFQIECTVEHDFFEDDRRWLVVDNGVIDLHALRETRSVVLLDHDMSRPVTRKMDVTYDPDAKPLQWLDFLASSQPDPELRSFLQTLAGAAFLAESKVKIIANLVGPKDCGKTVYISALDAVGGGYAVQPSPDALLASSGSTNFEQETIRGMRFVGVSEPSSAKKLDDAFVKQVTGGDITRTRTLHKESTGWLPQCVIHVASNHKVRFNTTDEALLERVSTITFPHRFWDASDAPPGEEDHIKDYTLEARLDSERSGILNWIIEGMMLYLDQRASRGLHIPESVKAARRETRAQGTTTMAWLDEMQASGRILVDPSADVRANSHYIAVSDAYRSYSMWCEENGEKALGVRMFSQDVQNQYGSVVNSGGKRFPRLVWNGAGVNAYGF